MLFQIREQSLRHVSFSLFPSHLLRARESGRAGLWNRRPQRYTYTGVRAIRFLGRYLRLLALSASVLRRRRRSRDYTAYICLHRVCTTTSNIHTRCLVWMESLMLWASVPPHGTSYFQYLCMFHFCLLLMPLVVHTCTYMSPHTSHWFSRLN
jgi:hypothetical protein